MNILDKHVRAYKGGIIYDFDNNIQLNWYPNRIVELMQGNESILEFGLGHGITTSIFNEYFNRHVVIEASEAVIQNFKYRYPNCNAEIVNTFFEQFDSNEKFDIVVLGFVLEHVDDPVLVMGIAQKFLKSEGKIFLAVPNAEVLNRRIGYEAGLLENMEILSEHDLLCGHKRYYTKETFTKDIDKAGLELEKMEGIYLKPLTTNQMLSLNLDKVVIEAICRVGINYPELCCGMLAQTKIKTMIK
ncbi:SAM-dependent methyltransferase [Clostridium sulfidigenes]|uniref:SAM-dependent methyltransferase n=1 Tax=Clostridium sulfidigenes TaxID=318464 RepID=A0A084JIM2_9CLOT|nr:class I SAM-dependent methyltransferase [Clostridium sulfidigenes]KEZ88806.1 SAM-dependent methyltransferase [Clostridium sulfidigenes]